MGAFLSFAEEEARTACDDVVAMVDKGFDELFDVERLGTAVDQSDVVDAERGLHLGHLVELVEDDIGVGIGFEFDDNAHAFIV